MDQPIQLFSCFASALKAKLNHVASCKDLLEKPAQKLLTLQQSLAVIPVAVIGKRIELLQMHQDSGKCIRNFLLHVKGKAKNCKFKMRYPHTHTAFEHCVYVDYTDKMIRYVILNCLYDVDFRKNFSNEANFMLVN